MESEFLHANLNVTDLEKSIRFYQEALGLKELRRVKAGDGSFVLAFLGDGKTSFQLELTWLRDHKKPYDLGENESHIAFRVGDREAAYELHKSMGCVCYENHAMNLYFIEDPDGYWLEILK